MQIDPNTKSQLIPLLNSLKSSFTFHLSLPQEHEQAAQFKKLFEELCELSPLLNYQVHQGDDLLLRVSKEERDLGVIFYAIPTEYEFSSLILLLLNADGQGKNLPSLEQLERIQAINFPLSFKTFILLTCPNCPDVVQAINVMTLMNKELTHSIYNTQTHEKIAKQLGIEAVPSVFVNGELLHVGRSGLDVLLDKVEHYLAS